MVPLSVFWLLVGAFVSFRSVYMNVEHQREIDDWITGVQSIYLDPFTSLEGSHWHYLLDCLMAISEEGAPLDYDRLVRFNEDYRIGQLNEIKVFIINYTQLCDKLLLQHLSWPTIT